MSVKKQQKIPELFGRRETGLPSAGAKINEMLTKHVHTRGFVLVYIHVLCNISDDWPVKNMDCSR